jgi:hypothetical protein
MPAMMITAKYKKIIITAAIFLFIWAIRLFFIIESYDIPSLRTPTPGMDIDLYWQAAGLIVEGASTDNPNIELMFPSMPLYPYWLAFWQIILGRQMFIYRVVNAMVASISAVMLFGLWQKLVRNRIISFCCLLLWGLLPSLIYFDSIPNKSSLGILVIILLIYTLLDIYRWSHRYYYPLKGLIIGVLVSVLFLLQGNTFLYSMVIFGQIVFFSDASKADKLKTLIAAISIVVTAIAIYQYQTNPLKNRYPWALPQKGIHFFIGFHKGANGTYHQVDHIRPWPYAHVFYSRMQAESDLKRRLTPRQADSYFLRKGLNFIRNHPKESLKLVLEKFYLFFNNYEIKGVDCLDYLKKRSITLAWAPFGLGILVMLSGPGVLWLVKQKEYALLFLFSGLLTAILVANILGFVTWRYRLHSTIPLSVLAAFGIQYLYLKTVELLRSKQPLTRRIPTYICAILIPLTICGWLTYRPVLTGYKEGYIKRAAANDFLSKRAQKRIQELERLDHLTFTDVRLEKRKALILNELHRHTHSYRLLKNLVENQHYDYATINKYIVYLLWLGDYEQATDLLKKVKIKEPVLVAQLSMRLKGLEKKVFDLFVKPDI